MAKKVEEAAASVLSPAGELLLRALKASGNAEAASRFGGVLRRWANEGKAYRGIVFGTGDVDAALKALQLSSSSLGASHQSAHAASASSPSASSSPHVAAPTTASNRSAQVAHTPSDQPAPGTGTATQAELTSAAKTQTVERRAVLRFRDWPPDCVRSASLEVAKAMGHLPVARALEHTSCAALMQGLCTSLKGGGGDLQIAAVPNEGDAPAKVAAHRLMLAAVSPVLKCNFDGRFKATSEITATGVSSSVVEALVRFIYLGQCDVPEADLTMMFTLADMWEITCLADGIRAHVSTLSAVRCWRMLVEDSFGVASISTELVTRVGQGFVAAASTLGRILASTAPPPPDAHIGDEEMSRAQRQAAVERAQAAAREAVHRQAENEKGWHFARQLADAVSASSTAAIRLFAKDWVFGEGGGCTGPLAEPMENFFVAALCAASRAELRVMGRLRFLLPRELDLRVVRSLREKPGLCDEDGNLLPWVDWASDATRDFEQLWCLYRTLRYRGETRESLDSVAHDADNPDDKRGLLSETDHLNWTVESVFSIALAGALEHDADAPAQLDALLERDGQRLPVVAEALHYIGRLLQRNPRALGRLPVRGVMLVLADAASSLRSSAVQIDGPPSVAGTYRISGGDGGTCFFREPVDGQEILELRRVPRAPCGTDGVRIHWTGMPVEQLRAAKTEWTIKRTGTVVEEDLPLAVSLDDAFDPADIKQSWWLHRKISQTFREHAEMQVRKTELHNNDVAPLALALRRWASKGGSLEAVRNMASGKTGDECHRNSCRPVVLQICDAACAIQYEGTQTQEDTAPNPTAREISNSVEAAVPQNTRAEADGDPRDRAAESFEDEIERICSPSEPCAPESGREPVVQDKAPTEVGQVPAKQPAMPRKPVTADLFAAPGPKPASVATSRGGSAQTSLRARGPAAARQQECSAVQDATSAAFEPPTKVPRLAGQHSADCPADGARNDLKFVWEAAAAAARQAELNRDLARKAYEAAMAAADKALAVEAAALRALQAAGDERHFV